MVVLRIYIWPYGYCVSLVLLIDCDCSASLTSWLIYPNNIIIIIARYHKIILTNCRAVNVYKVLRRSEFVTLNDEIPNAGKSDHCFLKYFKLTIICTIIVSLWDSCDFRRKLPLRQTCSRSARRHVK